MLGGCEPCSIQPAFCRYGETGAAGPVLITVPHAGREYPADLVERCRVGRAGLQALEDRHADHLASGAVAAGHSVLVARRGRAVIDLNRHPAEIDGSSVDAIPRGVPTRSSVKLRGGLGLVPHRYHSLGELWRSRPSYGEVARRVADIHDPYHAQVAQTLGGLQANFGTAILIDLHSMPPLRGHAEGKVDVVLGDRFGQSASAAICRRAAEIVASHGFTVAINTPYAGGYTLERHGRLDRNIHALQIEIDRTLYLDADMQEPGAGAPRCIAMIADLACTLAGAQDDVPLAAE